MMPESQSQPILPTPSIVLYRRIATTFLVLTIGSALIVCFVVFSRATVVVLAQQSEVKSDFIIDVARNPSDGEIGGDVREVSDSITQKFPSTSPMKIETRAEGRVRITNAFSRNQTLIATTRLATPDNIIFRLKKTIVILANGSEEVDVVADQVGVEGEMESATFIIPGLNPETRTFFKVVSVAPFQGGIKEEKVITKQDIDSAENILKEKLSASLIGQLREQVYGAKNAPKKMGEIFSVETVRKTTDIPIGRGASEFSLTLNLKVTGVFFDQQQYDETVKQHLKEQMAYDRSLVRVVNDVTPRTVEKYDVVGGRANIHVVSRGVVGLSVDSPSLGKEKLVGITVDAAKRYLEHLDGVSSASVRAMPFWLGRMPNIASHIKVEVR